jgi:hypothetical protein
MGAGHTQRNSYRIEREFGLIVGGVFVLLASWWFYRGRFETVTPWLFGVGTVLIVLGLVLPKALVLPNRAWMKLAHFLSLITTPIILAIVYFLIVTPIGVVKRMTGWDPLRRRGPDESSYWKPYADRQRDSRHYEKMY